MRALVDAHGPDAHSCASIGIQARHVAYGIFVDAANLGGSHRIILLDQFRKLFRAAGMSINVGLILQTFFENDMR